MKTLIIHPIGWETEPHCQNPDFWRPLEAALVRRGHSVVASVTDADVVCFDSGIWEISPGNWTRYVPEILAHVVARRIPVAFFDHSDHRDDAPLYGFRFGHWPLANATALAMASMDWSKFLHHAIPVCPFIYFLRKMHDTRHEYPAFVHPLEYALLEDFPLVSEDELFSRPNDIGFFGTVGHLTQRQRALNYLLKEPRLKCDLRDLHHTKRLSHPEWFAAHRQCKMFLEADNATLGSERPLYLMTVAPMAQIKGDQRLPFPRVDMKHYVEIGDYHGNISSADVDKLLLVLNDSSLLYSIYKNGAEFMREHYSMTARSNYIVDLLEEFTRKP